MQWQDVLNDKSLRDLPYKIELNQYGRIEMSPTSFHRSYLQGTLAFLLRSQLGGNIFTELAIMTNKGVKVPDVAWASNDYYQNHKNDINVTVAPDICIEIISSSNSMKEMQAKIKLYLKAGAKEVWIVNEQGGMKFFNAKAQLARSSFDVNLELFFSIYE